VTAPVETSSRSDGSRTDGSRTDGIRHQKLAAQVRSRMEADILASGSPVGTVIGSEAALLERYQVSRAVFREAVRLIEHHHLGTMKRGPGGGLVITAPDASMVADAMAMYLEYRRTSVYHLLQARSFIEPLAASLAARNIDEAGIARMRAVIEDEAEAGAALVGEGHHILHQLIAELSGNPAIYLFVEVLSRLIREEVAFSDDDRHAAYVSTGDDVRHAHVMLADAIISGDPNRAHQIATRHVAAMLRFLRETSSSVGPGDQVGFVAQGRDRKRDQNLVLDPHTKLAEVVARRIQRSIVEQGWAVGAVLGSESQLLETYGVSRAVLREAVRLLEHHSVATMRRGPGGGLVVTVPDPTAVSEAVTLYLEYGRPTFEDIHQLRTVLELGCIDLVTASSDPEVATALEATLALEATCCRLPDEHYGNALHLRLAELTGNPTLAMFVQIMTALWANHSTLFSPVVEPQRAQEGFDAVEHAHRAIVDAVVARDPGLARHRMTRHLEALTPWFH
jgi:DNA-binding FadR family transcriptional regulator